MGRTNSSRIATVARSKYWRQSYAEAALDALEDSGQSLSEFARQWGINDGRLRRWQRRLGREPNQSGNVTGLVAAFHPVEVVMGDTPRPESGVELLLRGGHRVVLHRGFDACVLEELLRAVDATTC
jgi:transposase-like protein